jgi:hypothetical protein
VYKEKQFKVKANGRKEIVKIGAQISNWKQKTNKINEIKCSLFENTNKINKILANLPKVKSSENTNS